MNRKTRRLLSDWLATQASANTRAAYGRDFAAFADWCDAADREPLDAGPDDLNRYRDDCLGAGARPATVTRRLSGLASFFRYAAGAGALEANPADEVERPAPVHGGPAALDDDEISSLLDAAESIGQKTAALIALLALDGMKLGEVLALDVGRVHRDGQAVSVDLARRGQQETLTLSGRSSELLMAYVARRRRGPLFLGESPTAVRPGPLTRFGADFLIKRAATAAGIDKPVSAGVLRRSYIGAAERTGTPLADIAQHVGHRQVRETTRLLEGRP